MKAKMLGYQKVGTPNARAAAPYWQVKRGNDCLCHGSMETFPGAGERKMLKADGYRISVEGKPWKEGQT